MSSAPPPPVLATRGRDALLALALAVLLGACWTLNDWAQLRYLNLPDTDDMMRLAQVRDWLAGQRFADWTQYRLGPPGGAPMHWSRVADLGPAAIIALATPLVGTPIAELAGVIAWPLLLFALYLYLSGRITRAMGAPDASALAIVVAALAFPANAMFLPGRIDHHGLQIILVQAMILALTRPRGATSGAAAGGALALSFGIGLETAPQAAALMAVMFWRFAAGRSAASHFVGFGTALSLGTLALYLLARPTFWTATWCDGFTPASVEAAIAGGLFWIAMGLAQRYPSSIAVRVVAGGALGAGLAAWLYARYPGCVAGPYGPMHPFLRSAIIDNITEARGAFAQTSVAAGLRATGLLFFATGVAGWLFARRPMRRDALLPTIAVLAVSALIALAQVRAAYIGTAVAAPVLAHLILAAREAGHWRAPALAAAWALSAGILWAALPLKVEALFMPPAIASAQARVATCRQGDLWRQIDAYPAGTIVTGIDHGARAIGGTRHRSLGAGYHRNNAGNAATYAFFIGDPERARRIARRYRVTYITFCPGDFGEIGITRTAPASMAARLERDEAPAWVTRLPLRDTAMRFYRID